MAIMPRTATTLDDVRWPRRQQACSRCRQTSKPRAACPAGSSACTRWSRMSSPCREPTRSAARPYLRWDCGGRLGRACKVAELMPTERDDRRVAAIDCGTNSLRLLVADIYPGTGELVDLHRRMEIVRLGEGVDATGKLARQALARTFAMLTEYAKTISASGARSVRMVATSATRDASNAAEFTAGVREILGIDPEVVSGAQEAYLSFSGATAELVAGASIAGRPGPPCLVVDTGCGSTEFVLGGSAAASSGGAPAELFASSLDLRCVRP